jgi:hypothetical protein
MSVIARIFASIFGRAAVEGESRPSNRDLELAALHNLDLPFSSAYFPKSDAELDRTQEWINSKRAWLLTIEDRRVRKAYAGWVDYAQTRLNENREENKTHKERRAYEARHKSSNEEWSRGRAVAKIIPKPSRD